MAFHYYDPVIQIINKLAANESKIYYSFKTEFRLNKIKSSNFKREFLTLIGVYEEPNDNKLSHSHEIINKS